MLHETSISRQTGAADKASESSLLDSLRAGLPALPAALGAPGPTTKELEVIVSAALTAFSTGERRSWRLISIGAKAMERLDELLADAKERRGPADQASSGDEGRKQKWRAPVQIAVVARLDPEGQGAPLRDQYIAVGAAIQIAMNRIRELAEVKASADMQN